MMGTQTRRVYLIDTSIFVFRYYFTMPNRWQCINGRPTETVFGFAQWLLGLLEKLEPLYIAACFDESLGTCFRNDMYPDYKKNRTLPDDNLVFQLLACKRLASLLGIPCFASQRYEADDLIGTFAQMCFREAIPYTILSRDKDLAQLLYSPDSVLWNYPDKTQLGPAEVFQKWGVHPHQIADFLAIVGDPGDDIPGVPGVGHKTASSLLHYFDSWENIKRHVDEIHSLPIRGAASLQKKLATFVTQVDTARQLTAIATAVMPVCLNEIRRKQIDKEAVIALCEGLGFPDRFLLRLKAL